ncbi:hypothetical protein [Parablautia muri]|uniref:Uncharacterized protein n=1 Tax=Parablautia muri TaxID=2320879 RepID=A0A9X5BDW0_9FIRM|nr:hypothetical protein [Parablautia muri]NBJ91627.1 hypothetical protein [Parablautia muri]
MRESDILDEVRKYLKTVVECVFWKEPGRMHGTAGIHLIPLRPFTQIPIIRRKGRECLLDG